MGWERAPTSRLLSGRAAARRWVLATLIVAAFTTGQGPATAAQTDPYRTTPSSLVATVDQGDTGGRPLNIDAGDRNLATVSEGTEALREASRGRGGLLARTGFSVLTLLLVAAALVAAGWMLARRRSATS